VFSLKPGDIIGSKIASGFDAAVLAVDGLEAVKRAVCRILEEKGDILMEPLLVVFDLDDIVSFFFDDGLRDFF